jgi:hypothetical protein
MDVAGGAFVIVEGDNWPHVQVREYELRKTVWRPSVLLGLALAIGIAIALLVYFLDTYWPLVFIWAPFVLIGIASATVTRVERTAKAFMISSGLNDAWQLAIKDVVRAGIVTAGPWRRFRMETSARDNCYGTKNYEFDLEDVDTFIEENFAPVCDGRPAQWARRRGRPSRGASGPTHVLWSRDAALSLCQKS